MLIKDKIAKYSFVLLLMVMTLALFYEPQKKLIVNVIDNVGCNKN